LQCRGIFFSQLRARINKIEGELESCFKQARYASEGIAGGQVKVTSGQDYAQAEFKTTVLDRYKDAADHYSNAIADNDEALKMALYYASKGAEIGQGGDIRRGAYPWARNIFGKPAEKALDWVQKVSAGQSSIEEAVQDLHSKQERQAFNFLWGAANRTADRRNPAQAVQDAQRLLGTTGLAVPDEAGGSIIRRADADLGGRMAARISAG
jgi:hypothetical protein